MIQLSLNINDLIGFLIVYQGFVFATSLFSNKAQRSNFNVILALLILCLSLNFLNMILINQAWVRMNFGPIFGLLYGPLCFIYSYSLIYAKKRLIRTDIKHFIPAFAMLISLIVFQSSLDEMINSPWLSVLIITHIGIYLSISLRKVFWFRRNLENVSSEALSANLSWLKYLILTTSFLFVIVFLESLIVRNETLNGVLVIVIYIFTLFFVNSLYWRSIRQPKIFGGFSEITKTLTVDIANKYSSSTLEEIEAKGYLQGLQDFMRIERPYLHYSLTIEGLSEKTGIPTRYLSQIINQQLNQNFFDFINNYRLEEAKLLLLDTSKNLRINEVMYDAGFNSKSTFNFVFKKSTGMTPSEFRKAFI